MGCAGSKPQVAEDGCMPGSSQSSASSCKLDASSKGSMGGSDGWAAPARSKSTVGASTCSSCDCGAGHLSLDEGAFSGVQRSVPHALNDIALGRQKGRWCRAPVFRSTWNKQRVHVMIAEHVVADQEQAAQLEATLKQVAASPALAHPHLLRVLCCELERLTPCEGSDEEESFGRWLGQPLQRCSAWVVAESCRLGSLDSAIQQGWLRQCPILGAPPHLRYVLLTAKEVASALLHLHSHGLVHGRLDGGSVLLCTSPHPDSRCFTAKVCPAPFFVPASAASNGRSLGRKEMAHTAPEVLIHGQAPTPAADAYSWGVLLWEMLEGRLAWGGLSFGQVVKTVAIDRAALPAPAHCPPALAALLAACLHPDPAARPSLAAVVAQLEQLLGSSQVAA